MIKVIRVNPVYISVSIFSGVGTALLGEVFLLGLLIAMTTGYLSKDSPHN